MAVPNPAGSMLDLLCDREVATAMRSISNISGLSPEAVAAILQASLPVLARSARRNPDLFTLWYARSTTMYAVGIQHIYARLAEQPEVQARLLGEFGALFGEAADESSSVAAQKAETTRNQAATVIAFALPAIDLAIARQTDGAGEAGMMAWVKAVSKA
jgi:hypothetical protein